VNLQGRNKARLSTAVDNLLFWFLLYSVNK